MSHSDPSHAGRIKVGHAELAYEVSGSGPAVVLVHAGIADRRMWDPQVTALATHYRVVRYDLRGFGESTGGTDDYAHHEDLAHLIAELDLGPVGLVGCSFGGRVAIDAALSYPALVEQLALINPALGGYPWPAELDASEEAIEAAVEAGNLDAAAEVDLRVWVDGPSRQPDEVDADVRERARVMARQVYDAGEPAGSMVALAPPAIERLGELRAPTLVISGELDQPLMRDIATLIGERVAGSRVVSLPGVAHLASMEAPDAVNDLLLDFFNEQDTEHEYRGAARDHD